MTFIYAKNLHTQFIVSTFLKSNGQFENGGSNKEVVSLYIYCTTDGSTVEIKINQRQKYLHFEMSKI